MTAAAPAPVPGSVAPLGLAGAFVDALAGRDFAGLAACLAGEARLRCLLPGGERRVDGAGPVAEQFRAWFGGPGSLEMLGASVGEVGGRMHLRWRFRVDPAPRAPGPHVVEQHVFADADPEGRIAALDLLCSGFRAGPPTASE
jgi:hypothetical protein